MNIRINVKRVLGIENKTKLKFYKSCLGQSPDQSQESW
jgi:hypothetical protein